MGYFEVPTPMLSAAEMVMNCNFFFVFIQLSAQQYPSTVRLWLPPYRRPLPSNRRRVPPNRPGLPPNRHRLSPPPNCRR